MAAAISVNLAGFHAHWTKWLAERETEVTHVVGGLAAEIFMYALHETPQYTGEAVSNWSLSVNSPEFSYQTGEKDRYRAQAVKGLRTPYNKASGGGVGPNFHAMDHAIDTMNATLAGPRRVTDKLFITNATLWDRGSVTEIIENQPSWLRSENMQGTIPAAAVSYVAEKYRVIDALGLRQLVGIAT